MNEVQAAVSNDDPMLIAWNAYQKTEAYKSTRWWAIDRSSTGEHANVDGSLWAAFCRGWRAAKETAE